jgi:tetratricopeptide (TPR) repeat protein
LISQFTIHNSLFSIIVERTPVYCQNCRARNSLKQSHCQNCGTRLLLVVFPQSLQYDTNHVPSFYEDHLLERVSLLELRLVQMSESLRIAMEIIREQGKIVKENQSQVRFINKKLGRRSEKKATPNKPGGDDNVTQTLENIIAEHDSPNVELFTKLLAEGLKLLEMSEEKEAFRMLDRAVLLSPRNISLLFFTARTYFFADRFSDAKKLLERAFELAPDNINVLFLLGVIYADEAEVEKARLFLSILAEQEKTSCVVNFIWGILAAFEGNWTESLAAFKLAFENEIFPELQYLIGCAYFQQKEEALALRHFQRTISLDRKYSDAWFMQAVIYHLQNDPERARNMLVNATELKEAGAQSAEFVRKNKLDPEAALPFQHFKKKDPRLLTGGALRLARFLKFEIGKAFE